MLNDTDTAVGIVDCDVLIKNENGGIVELGYFIKPEFWGNGFGTEMSSALVDFIFTELNIHKINASCHAQNISSENIMKKIGMTYEGLLRKVRYKDGSWADEVKYGLLREDWEKSKKVSLGE